ncbi:MAG TPA: multicopper oxidase domain-containing protein [Xanthobacteraceae bacterium]
MPNDRTKPLRSEPAPRLAVGALGRTLARRRLALPAAFAALMLAMPMAHAGDCPSDQRFFKVPEIVSQTIMRDGKPISVLRGTMELTDAQVLMMTRFPPQGQTKAVAPGTPGAIYNCFAQTVRAFRIFPAQPLPAADGQTVPDPYPGPTLRARLGDIVELTFVNDLDPARFGKTDETGAQGTPTGCDVVAGVYPGPDKYADCFHGSSTGNIHFHGTHTNPNGTGDNVLLEVRPSPRDAQNRPTITPDTYKKEFDTFFAECERHLVGNPLEEWPRNWQGPNDPRYPGGSSLGPWTKNGTWTATQMGLLNTSDKAANESVVMKNRWPQYYIGAYPYCFQLPFYPASSFPPPKGTLQMGQAPGTHWYHAHKHGSTAIDVANGMVGAFIIEGPSYDGELDKFYGTGWTRTQPVMVINQPGVAPNMMRKNGPARQDKGPDLVVNGRFGSIIDMAPGEVQMWRIVNGSGRSGVFIKAFPAGFHFRQIAQDGVQFADVNYQQSEDQSLLLASGNRADLLVMAPKAPGIYPLMVQHEVDPSDLTGSGAAIPVVLVQIRVNKDLPAATGPHAQFIPAMPKPPAFLDNITAAEANAPRTVIDPRCHALDPNSTAPCGTASNPRVVVFSTVPPAFKTASPGAQHMIDDRQFEENADDTKVVTLDTVEEWQIENTTTIPGPVAHPFHIHVNPFQIVEVFDPNATVVGSSGQTLAKYITTKPTPQNQNIQCQIDLDNSATWFDCHNTLADDKTPRVWWDVFPIPSPLAVTVGGKNYVVPGHFRMRSRFVDFPGEYVIHCHILAHEDRGMMALVELRAPTAPSLIGLYHHH